MNDIKFQVEVKFEKFRQRRGWLPVNLGIRYAIKYDRKAATRIVGNQLKNHPHSGMVRRSISLEGELSPENLKAHESRPTSRGRGSIPEGTFHGIDPWLIVVTIPLTTLLTSFMTEAGKDAYEACKEFFSKLLTLKPKGSSLKTTIEIHDPKLGRILTVYAPLPDQAWRELATMALPDFPDGRHSVNLYWKEGWHINFTMPIPDSHIIIVLKWHNERREWMLIRAVTH